MFGVNIHFTGPHDDEVGKIADAGFRFIRVDLTWAGIERTKGQHSWYSPYDGLFTSLSAKNIRPIFVLDYANPLYESGRPPHTAEGRTAFAEFAAEVRSGRSVVLFMPQYRRSLPVRILESVWDVLRRYPEYPGRERWTDRIFYRVEDGAATPLSTLWKHRMPWFVREVLT